MSIGITKVLIKSYFLKSTLTEATRPNRARDWFGSLFSTSLFLHQEAAFPEGNKNRTDMRWYIDYNNSKRDHNMKHSMHLLEENINHFTVALEMTTEKN